jgi:hypothetical protein
MAYSLENYVPVNDRILRFKELFPDGSLAPLDPSRPFWIEDVPGIGPRLVYVAAAYRTPDDPRPGIGMAWEPLPGQTPYTRGSELMVAETSAWGRALAALGIGVNAGIATSEDVQARKEATQSAPVASKQAPPHRTTPPQQSGPEALLSEAQDRLITRLLGQAGVITPPAKAAYLTDVLGREVKSLSSITKREASKVIDRIREQPPAPAEEEAF